MTELFDSYTGDIDKSFSTIKSTLSQFKQSPLSKQIFYEQIGKKQASLPSVKIELYEIEKLIKLMETEIVSFSGRQRNSMAQKIKGYKVDYDTLRKKIVIVEEEVQKQRNALNKDPNTPNTTSHSLELNQRKSTNKSRSKYSRLQQSTRSDDEDVNFKLKQSVKVMYEISDMSDNISYELAGQTDKMQQNVSKLGKIRGQLIKGEKKIKKIMIRLRRNQLVLYVVILMVVLMAAFLLVKIFG